MFRDLPPYAQTTQDPFWSAPPPSHWSMQPGLAVLQENRRKNDGLIESRVLSLSYGRVVVKPVEKQRGLVPDSYEGDQILDPGDIVVRPTDLQNDQTSIRVGHVKDHGIITSAYIGLRPTGGWSDSYAYLYLTVVDSSKRIYGMGSGLRQQLGWSDLKRMPCLVPPAEEQAAIVKYLAHASARIDKTIAAKRSLISLLEEQKRTAVSEIIGRIKGGNRELRHVLSQLVDCEHKTAPFVEDGLHWILRTSAVRAGLIEWSGAYTTDAVSYESWTKRAVPEAGDVIFTREAPVGEAAVIPEGRKVALGQRTVLMKVRDDVMVPQFLVYQIYGGMPRARILQATQGSTVGHFNMDDIGWMRVVVPEVDRQHAVVAQIDEVVQRSDEAMSTTRREIALLQEFRTRLVADVVTGQVDVRAIAATLPDAPESIDNTVSATDDDLEEALSEGEE